MVEIYYTNTLSINVSWVSLWYVRGATRPLLVFRGRSSVRHGEAAATPDYNSIFFY